MLNDLKQLFARLASEDDGGAVDADELKIATAALLVRAAAIDGNVAASERAQLETVLERRFALGPDEAATLVEAAAVREREAVDLYSFTSVLQRQLTQEERQTIVALMWEVVAADGEVHPYESNLVWRAAELIGVSTRDRVRLRQEVFARHGIGGGG